MRSKSKASRHTIDRFRPRTIDRPAAFLPGDLTGIEFAPEVDPDETLGFISHGKLRQHISVCKSLSPLASLSPFAPRKMTTTDISNSQHNLIFEWDGGADIPV